MKRDINQAFQALFNPSTITPFLLGSIVLAILGNAIYDVIKLALGAEVPQLLSIILICLLLMAGLVGLLVFLVNQNLKKIRQNTPSSLIQRRVKRKYRGLIFLISREDACRKSIEFHLPTLERCWLLCSTQTLPAADNLRQEFPLICVDSPLVVNDILDPNEFRDLVNQAYDLKLPGWSDMDIIVDYAGMTAHGSVGVVLACLNTLRPMQYTPAVKDASGRICGSAEPIEVILDRS
jgi:hypothetical protein